jgi:hypothetical protein
LHLPPVVTRCPFFAIRPDNQRQFLGDIGTGKKISIKSPKFPKKGVVAGLSFPILFYMGHHGDAQTKKRRTKYECN